MRAKVRTSFESGRRPGPAERSGDGAFTLLEVMASLMIFAMTAIVLGSAYLNVLNSYAAVGKGHENDQDVAFCRQELLRQADLQSAENGDQFNGVPPPGALTPPQVQWSSTIDQANEPDLFTVVLTVQIAASPTATPTVITQTFMLLRPTWSDPATQSSLRASDATRIGQLQGTQQ
jgi:general secretion pathway protein I